MHTCQHAQTHAYNKHAHTQTEIYTHEQKHAHKHKHTDFNICRKTNEA